MSQRNLDLLQDVEYWKGMTAECRANVADLRRQLEEANTAATMYKAMVCSQSCKMCFPPPDGEPLPWDDLQAEIERLRKAARWEVEKRACIHTSVRSGFGVGCSRCHAAATLLGLGWHSMIDEIHPSAALDEKG